MTENNKTRGRYVLFTIALDLLVTDKKEAAEMRGYNWLARRLTPRYASGSAAELLTFKTVAVDDRDFQHAPAKGDGDGDARWQTCGYIVRLHGDYQAGEPAPDWLVQMLAAASDGAGVRFCGITPARAALLMGRSG